MNRYHVAQLNVARLRAPPDSPALADFVALLDPINAIADAAAGFVWENMTGKINGWKRILNALTIHYGDRIATTNR